MRSAHPAAMNVFVALAAVIIQLWLPLLIILSVVAVAGWLAWAAVRRPKGALPERPDPGKGRIRARAGALRASREAGSARRLASSSTMPATSGRCLRKAETLDARAVPHPRAAHNSSRLWGDGLPDPAERECVSDLQAGVPVSGADGAGLGGGFRSVVPGELAAVVGAPCGCLPGALGCLPASPNEVADGRLTAGPALQRLARCLADANGRLSCSSLAADYEPVRSPRKSGFAWPRLPAGSAAPPKIQPPPGLGRR